MNCKETRNSEAKAEESFHCDPKKEKREECISDDCGEREGIVHCHKHAVEERIKRSRRPNHVNQYVNPPSNRNCKSYKTKYERNVSFENGPFSSERPLHFQLLPSLLDFVDIFFELVESCSGLSWLDAGISVLQAFPLLQHFFGQSSQLQFFVGPDVQRKKFGSVPVLCEQVDGKGSQSDSGEEDEKEGAEKCDDGNQIKHETDSNVDSDTSGSATVANGQL